MNTPAIEKRIRAMLPAELQANFDTAPSIDDEGWQAIFSRYCWTMMEHCVTTASKQSDPFDQQGIRKEALQWAGELRKLKYLDLQQDSSKRPGGVVLHLAGFNGPEAVEA
jgi:hypothetical protein